MIIATREPSTVITVTGADARRYLHSQLSNDITGLAVGSSCYSLLLEPVGRVVALFRVFCATEDAFVLEFDTAVEASVIDAVVKRLSRFLIRTKAVIETSEVGVVRVRSNEDETLPASLRDFSGARPAWWCDGRAVDVVGDPDPSLLAHLTSSDGGEGLDAIEVERVRSGWPANGRDIVAGETIPASLGVVPIAVSFTKGCYPGQELVERMDSRGSTAPRTLRVIEEVGLGVGDDVLVDGAVVGTVTSAAGGRALAFVDRAIDVGERVSPRT
jgi:folate-binding protein YgfZ